MKIRKQFAKIALKPKLLDIGIERAVEALTGLGFDAVADVRQGKYIEVELNESDTEAARSTVSDMCEKLLANTVIENYDIEIVA